MGHGGVQCALYLRGAGAGASSSGVAPPPPPPNATPSNTRSLYWTDVFAQRYHVDQPRTQIKRKGNSGGDLHRTAGPSLR
jgi:hypothetical protein